MEAKATPRHPLAGTLVLDLSENIAGSHAAALLAEAGARVVKVRRPDANPLESMPAWTRNGEAAGVRWKYANRGKELWEVDFGSSKGRNELNAAIAAADVVINSMPDEAAGDAGLDPTSVHRMNPRVVVATVAPFGASGPHAGYRADDLVSMASSGLMHSTPGFPDFVPDLETGPPLRPSSEMAELAAGVVGAAGCVEALIQRDRSSKPQRVDVSVQEAIAALLEWDCAIYNYSGEIIARRESRAGLSPNSYLPCKDGWVVVVAFMDHHWQQLVEMMGNPDWAGIGMFDTMTDRGANWDSLEPLIRLWLAEQERLDVMAEAQKRGLPTCAALEIPEAFDNEQTKYREFYKPLDGGRVPGAVAVVNGERVDTPPQMPVATTNADSLSSHVPSLTSGQGTAARMGSLAGIRIIDFGHIVAVPLAAQWLAFMGAEVIQIESRTNLPSRKFAPIIGDPPENTSGVYNHVNRNKKSVTINLRDPRGAEFARQLVSTADVVVENFSAGTMEKLGLGYEDLRRVKPDLVMLSLSAFGHDGPWRDYAALHSGVMLLSGLAAVTGYEGGHPRMCGSIFPDGLAASRIALSVLLAIHHRLRTGEGQYVQLAMAEIVQSLLPEPIYEFTRFGAVRPRLGNSSPHVAPHNVYRSVGEDAWIAISVGSDEEWKSLTGAMSRPELATDDRFSSNEARLENVEELDSLISEWARSVPASDASARLQKKGIAAFPVMSIRDILADPHLRERGFLPTVEHPLAGAHDMPARPWHLVTGNDPEMRHAPLLGDWNDEFFRGMLGLSEEEVQRLIEEQVIL